MLYCHYCDFCKIITRSDLEKSLSSFLCEFTGMLIEDDMVSANREHPCYHKCRNKELLKPA